MQPATKTLSNQQVLGGLGAWLTGALALGASGLQARLPMPGPQIILASLTGLLVLLYWRCGPVRAWVLGVDLRWLVWFHLTRFVGFYFLYLHSRGELPYAFAVPGGVGDIAVALTALVVVAAPPGEAGLKIYKTWNLLGFIDILLVVITAARLGFANPASMKALTHLPLSLLITFVVPIIIATHIFIFIRLNRMQAATQPREH
jgi:hypothetical protein